MSGTRSTDLEVRRAAYGGLPPLAERTLREVEGARGAALVLGIVDASVKMERYAAQEAQEKAHAMDLERIVVPAGTELPSTGELIAARQKRYERETGADRPHESLSGFIKWARFLEELPRRAPTPEELAIAEQAAHTRDLFLLLTGVYAELLDKHRAAGALLSSTYREERWPKAHSGLGQLTVGGNAALAGDGPPHAELLVRSAFLSERLGDCRANGLDPLAEVRLLESTLRWRVGAGLPTFEELEMNVLRARTMPREPSLMRNTLWQNLGFGAGATFVRDAGGNQSYLAYAEFVVPLAATLEYEHHLVLGFGPALGAAGELLPSEASAGGRVELSGRTQLSAKVPLSIRFDASWTPLFRALGGPRVWTHEARAALHVELAPSSRAAAQVELLLSARFRWAPGKAERLVGAALLVGTP